MTGTSPDTFDYGLDAGDAVAWVSDAWRAFARANGAPGLCSDALIGQSIWEYVEGDATRDLYRALFHRVRSERKQISIPFRCDSPDRFRFMRLDVAPAGGNDLDLRAQLIREQARPHLSILDRAFPRSLVTLVMCSVCLRLCVLGTEWVEVEDAVARFDLFDSVHQPALDYDVCDDCVGRLGAFADPDGDAGGATPPSS